MEFLTCIGDAEAPLDLGLGRIPARSHAAMTSFNSSAVAIRRPGTDGPTH